MLGMRKTSFDQLTQTVGILKGSFYRYFASSKTTIFAVLEDVHTGLYGVADWALRANKGANWLTLFAGAGFIAVRICAELFE